MDDQLRALLAVNSGLAFSYITDEASLYSDLGLDSLDLVDLVIQMEDIYHISISDDDYQQLQTVKQLCDFVQTKVVTLA